MDRLFGTDGIRAVAGEAPLDYSTICHIGTALVSLLGEEGLEPRILIGRDTRESGGWIEEALFQGIRRRGGTAACSGIIPTSAISYLTKKHGFSAGIVISASHNPFQDNGIKIFSSRGTKIPDAWERKIEKAIKKDLDKISREKTSISPQESFTLDYMKFLKDLFSHVALNRKIKVVLDCSNGASSFIAPRVFSELGVETVALNNSPDGKNTEPFGWMKKAES